MEIREVLETIGYVIGVAMIFGFIGTVAFVAAVFICSDTDCTDQDDIEIREHNFWNKKKKKR